MKHVSFTVIKEETGWRLDKTLRGQYPDWGRNAVKRILNARQVRVNGKAVWLGSWKVRGGDQIEIKNPPAAKPQGPEKFQKNWLIEDVGGIIAVNKPAGLRTHATRAGGKDNLLNLAQIEFGEVAVAHRLDRDTSGVILLTRPDASMRAHLDHCFQTGATEKEYIAVVASGNRLSASGQIDHPLAVDPQRKDKMIVVKKNGQRALTLYEVLAEEEGKQLLRLHPKTGRMHQLRVHLASMGAPILGDRLYGQIKSASRLMLHARRLGLPAGENIPEFVFEANVDDSFSQNFSPKILDNLMKQ